MTDKWTPGPRSIEEHDEDGMTVWDTYVHVPGEDNGDLLVGKFATRADAALDAAAPELVEALRGLVDFNDAADWCRFCEHIGDEHYPECLFPAARALLARLNQEANGD